MPNQTPIPLFKSRLVQVLLTVILISLLDLRPTLEGVVKKRAFTSQDALDLFYSFLTVGASAVGIGTRVRDRNPVFTADWLPGPNATDYLDQSTTKAQDTDSQPQDLPDPLPEPLATPESQSYTDLRSGH